MRLIRSETASGDMIYSLGATSENTGWRCSVPLDGKGSLHGQLTRAGAEIAGMAAIEFAPQILESEEDAEADFLHWLEEKLEEKSEKRQGR